MPKPTQKLKTPAQIHEWFAEQGISVAEWARQNGFGVSNVHAVINDAKPCLRGQSHQIAVLLGVKKGVISRSPAAAKQRGPHTARQTSASAAIPQPPQPATDLLAV